MDAELNTKKNDLHDDEYWEQIAEELAREEEEDIENLLEEMTNQR